jgi:ATP-dependent Clp protease protease subunit
MNRTIVEESQKNLIVLDVMSKLVQERIVFIDGEINSDIVNEIISQLLYLDSLNNSPIKIYINSDGGDISQGLAIYDICKIIKSPIITIGIGRVASMGAVLMLCGDVRKSLKHTRYLLHQPSLGINGTYTEVDIYLKEVGVIKKELYDILKKHINISNLDEYLVNDRWFGAEEALELGLLTEIINGGEN